MHHDKVQLTSMSTCTDKATTERNARILRDLVKQPDNKSCADCRKNDARWASWNLGVFLCIRCSGIHRSMGTHISKVKSIDLDIWTPEQMENIQKWGNRLANLYWEKHLKAGHVPPDHKIESFIRSKYESKRWAMDGPQPRDPSVLENGSGETNEAPRPTPTTSAPTPAPAAAPAPKHHPLLSRTTKPSPAPTPAPMVDLFGSDEPPSLAPPVTTSAPPKPQSTAAGSSAPAPGQTAGSQPPAPTGNSIFDLDFRTPTPSSTQNQPKNAKADIMSLFSNSTSPSNVPAPAQNGFFNAPPPPQQSGFGSWNGGITSSAPPQQYQQTQSALPVSSSGGWGGALQMDQNAWGSSGSQSQSQPQPQQQQQQPQQQQHQQQTGGFGGNPWGTSGNTSTTADPWASSNTSTNNSGFFGGAPNTGLGGSAPQQKKDDRDPFANIWG
ncbi:uncharacterized protein I206_105668 [Kwoniella pini CBS 10737]|uniref:Arf-GAP domain-containing protein n=1 Tax=Kwoniella pini CBS 10737 TaxID=1296096 RepID=A0A1B9I3K8_9TREE|nr:uncharacterized protein I206_03430 [Kwoniella pini CBS 10737]OCF50113.1 hypothetical protein I206_03430 [Kwoniella pini CBS 10737]